MVKFLTKYHFKFDYKTKTDVEIILHLYDKGATKQTICILHRCLLLFFWILSVTKYSWSGRDIYRVKPLFRTMTEDGFFDHVLKK
jgi:asparagine synthetase B (glutamine-hydrolysing)